MIGVAPGSALDYAALMTTPTPMAGGFFLILPIVIGFLWGIAIGQAMQGAIIGLGIGLMFALVIWLVDRLRQRR